MLNNRPMANKTTREHGTTFDDLLGWAASEPYLNPQVRISNCDTGRTYVVWFVDMARGTCALGRRDSSDDEPTKLLVFDSGDLSEVIPAIQKDMRRHRKIVAGRLNQQAAKNRTTTKPIEWYAARVERAKREILEDVRAGRVPRDIARFSDLDNYADANTYGGLCDDFFDEFDDSDSESAYVAASVIQEMVNAWIELGGIAQVIGVAGK